MEKNGPEMEKDGGGMEKDGAKMEKNGAKMEKNGGGMKKNGPEMEKVTVRGPPYPSRWLRSDSELRELEPCGSTSTTTRSFL